MNATFTISPDDIRHALGIVDTESLMPAHNAVLIQARHNVKRKVTGYAVIGMNHTTVRAHFVGGLEVTGTPFDCAIPAAFASYAVEHGLTITVGNGRATVTVDGARVATKLLDVAVPSRVDIDLLEDSDGDPVVEQADDVHALLNDSEEVTLNSSVTVCAKRLMAAIKGMVGFLYLYACTEANRVWVMDEHCNRVYVHA